MDPIEAELVESELSPPEFATQWQRLLHSRGMIFTVLFLATGALGLPILWRSPVFRRGEKLLWSAIVVIYTALLLWIVLLIVRSVVRDVIETLQL